MMDYRDNVQNCRDYIRALEEEQRKIQVFQRELPLCLQLVTQTIEAYKQQLSGTTTATTGECFNGGEAGKHPKQQESECSEQTTGDGGPIFEEFIPINRASSSAYNEHNDDEVLPSHESKMTKMIRDSGDNIYDNDKSEMKSDWLRSAQLWNQTTSFPPFPSTKEEHHHNLPRKVLVVEVKKNGRGGAFQPFQKDKTNATAADGGGSTSKPASTPAASACSTAEEAPAPGGANNSGSSVGKKDDKDGGQTQRKTRRCWSPELHRRFLNALQQLGGSHVATPKQIRDLMKVDGLTNDEVKSHLQKYRLHTRRPAPATHHNSTNNTQAQQFVIVGGIWVPPPPEYAAATALGATATVSVATAAASNGRIHTPIATTPQRPVTTESTGAAAAPAQFSHSDEGGRSHSDGGRVRSNSPASSSSTHTTTASPAF